MVTYQAAYKIAQALLSKEINYCSEYEKGYVFGHEEPGEEVKYIGGYGHTPCAVLKSSGKAIPFNAFVIKGTGKRMKDYLVDDAGNRTETEMID